MLLKIENGFHARDSHRVKGHLTACRFNNDVVLFIEPHKHASPNLATLHGGKQTKLYFLACTSLKVLGAREFTLNTGGGDFQEVGLLNGVGLVKQGVYGVGHLLAILNGDTLGFVNGDAEDPISPLFHLFNLPKQVSKVFSHRGNEGTDGFSHTRAVATCATDRTGSFLFRHG